MISTEPNAYHDQLDPEVILPSQLLADRAPAPARRLLLELIEDAIRTIRRVRACAAPDADDLEQLAEACAWFESTECGWLFNFEAICAVLDLDAGALRDAVLDEGRAIRRRHRLGSRPRALEVS